MGDVVSGSAVEGTACTGRGLRSVRSSRAPSSGLCSATAEASGSAGSPDAPRTPRPPPREERANHGRPRGALLTSPRDRRRRCREQPGLALRAPSQRGAAARRTRRARRTDRAFRRDAGAGVAGCRCAARSDFVNTAFRVSWSGAPDEALLDRLLRVERELGRVREERWGARTLDLDILWAERPFRSRRLVVPHPALELRSFALAPLLDVAPELEHRYRRFLRHPPPRAKPGPLDAKLRPPRAPIRRITTHEAADVASALEALGETPGSLLSLDDPSSVSASNSKVRFVRFA
ncbi:MAG: 2-amino-4-hydroxy-6-hydroxymethyldihydropteridine diphosphokinase [Sandaracinus sp.]|nr:2-amino-4-hydroxy-6-hydroxymethyldihydropteridine diphosphokinase [Sandaracinus sp.]